MFYGKRTRKAVFSLVVRVSEVPRLELSEVTGESGATGASVAFGATGVSKWLGKVKRVSFSVVRRGHAQRSSVSD